MKTIDDLSAALKKPGIVVWGSCRKGFRNDMPIVAVDMRRPSRKEPLLGGRVDAVIGDKVKLVSDHNQGGLVPFDSLIYKVDLL